jgi:uncharacterized protein (DUF1330 family)
MTAYIVFTRERLRDTKMFEAYREAAPPTLQGHPVTRRASYGQFEVLEGAAIEGAVILEFPSLEAAKTWYESPAYREARQLRFAAADYRVVIVEGL